MESILRTMMSGNILGESPITGHKLTRGSLLDDCETGPRKSKLTEVLHRLTQYPHLPAGGFFQFTPANLLPKIAAPSCRCDFFVDVYRHQVTAFIEQSLLRAVPKPQTTPPIDACRGALRLLQAQATKPDHWTMALLILLHWKFDAKIRVPAKDRS